MRTIKSTAGCSHYCEAAQMGDRFLCIKFSHVI
uniref:Uncharacterized protein n=1 Tax=Myoviridae sp. ctBoB21 TaxID=2827287 RepID=A0A8S5R5P9_9CAUD|nr:MAG TPA: hypothetical protein [Myoviridae sp. ctBoB21]